MEEIAKAIETLRNRDSVGITLPLETEKFETADLLSNIQVQLTTLAAVGYKVSMNYTEREVSIYIRRTD